MRMERKTFLRVIRFIQMKLHQIAVLLLSFENPPFSICLKNNIKRAVTCRVFFFFLSKKYPVFYLQSFQNGIGPKRGWDRLYVMLCSLCAPAITVRFCSSAEEQKLMMWLCYHLATSLHSPTCTTFPFPWAPKGDWPWRCWTERQLPPDWRRMDAACGDDDVSGHRAVVYFWVAGCCVVGVPGCGCC